MSRSLSRWICRITPFALAAAFILAALSGCGGSDATPTTTDFEINVPTTPSTTSPTATTTEQSGKKDDSKESANPWGEGGSGGSIEPVGAIPACNPSTLGPAVKAWGKKKGSKATLATPNYKCADGWAIALANVGPASQGYASTVIFVARNGTWSPQDRSKVCPKPSPVPKSLYQLGCNSN